MIALDPNVERQTDRFDHRCGRYLGGPFCRGGDHMCGVGKSCPTSSFTQKKCQLVNVEAAIINSRRPTANLNRIVIEPLPNARILLALSVHKMKAAQIKNEYRGFSVGATLWNN